MAIGLKYSTVPSQDNKTRKSNIKGQTSSVEFPADGLKYLLGVGYDAGDNTAIPYLVSTKNIPNQSSDFDIKDLTDSTNLRTTWSGKQDPISVSAPLTKTGNTISVDLSSKSISVEKVPTAGTSDDNAYCQALLQGGSVICYVPVSTAAGLTYAKEYYATSDKSMKENVSEVTPDNNIFNVPIVEFNWKDTKAKSVGVIAQDLEKVAPIAVSTSDSGMKSVNYTTFLLLRIAALEDRISKLEDKVNELSK